MVRKHISSQDHVVGQNIGNTRELELGNVSSKPERLEPVHGDKEFVGEGHLEKYWEIRVIWPSYLLLYSQMDFLLSYSQEDFLPGNPNKPTSTQQMLQVPE